MTTYRKVTYSIALCGPCAGERQTLTDVVSVSSRAALIRKLGNRHRMIGDTEPRDVRIEAIEPAPMSTWRIRVGDGNQGTFDQGTIEAPTAEAAFRAAGVSVARCEIDGDEDHLIASRYSSRLDYCPYVAEAIRED